MGFVTSVLIFFFQIMKVYLLQIQNIYTIMGFTSADFYLDASKVFNVIFAFLTKKRGPL